MFTFAAVTVDSAVVLGQVDNGAAFNPSFGPFGLRAVLVPGAETPASVDLELLGPDGVVATINDAAAPYDFPGLGDLPAGVYTLTATARDAEGGALGTSTLEALTLLDAPAPFAPVTVQAEDAEIVLAPGSATAIRTAANPESNGTLRPEFSGEGYVDYGSTSGDTLTITVTAPAGGAYDLNIRYASAGARPMALTINGAPLADAAFATTDPDGAGPLDGFNFWQFLTRTVTLLPGDNTVTLTGLNNTGPNLDRFEITAAGTGPLDLTADAGDDLAAAPEAASVASDALGAVSFRLEGVDADIVAFEVSLDGGVTFAPVTATVDGADRLVTLDLDDFAGAQAVEAIFRVSDEVGNAAQTSAQVELKAPFESLLVQGEALTIIPNGSGSLARTQSGNPETGNAADFDSFGLRPGYTGVGYLDVNGAIGDKASLVFDGPSGDYQITLRLANGSTSVGTGNGINRPMSLWIDGVQVATIPNTNTGAWNAWQTRAVTVSAEGPGPMWW